MNKVIWIQLIVITFFVLPAFSQNDTLDCPLALMASI